MLGLVLAAFVMLNFELRDLDLDDEDYEERAKILRGNFKWLLFLFLFFLPNIILFVAVNVNDTLTMRRVYKNYLIFRTVF